MACFSILIYQIINNLYNMKKVIVYSLFAFILGFGFTSCSSDDGGGSGGSNSELVGKWKKIGITDDEGSDIAYHYHECETLNDYIQFAANGTVKDVEYYEDCQTTEEDSGTYSVNGNILNVQGSNPDGSLISGQLTITSMTATSLKMKSEEMGIVIVYEAY